MNYVRLAWLSFSGIGLLFGLGVALDVGAEGAPAESRPGHTRR